MFVMESVGQNIFLLIQLLEVEVELVELLARLDQRVLQVFQDLRGQLVQLEQLGLQVRQAQPDRLELLVLRLESLVHQVLLVRQELQAQLDLQAQLGLRVSEVLSEQRERLDQLEE
jgi:hypothetical protein